MRILIAEDNTSLATAVETILEKNNYSADIVSDGAEALQYIESSLYDAVILDIMMPGVDGITVLKTVRQQKNNIPILLLTAKAEIEDKVSGLDAGANDLPDQTFRFKRASCTLAQYHADTGASERLRFENRQSVS